MGHVFKHPKYYEELRKKREENLEATSSKQQAIDETVPHCDIEEAASCKPQAPKDSSRKRQAASPEQQASSDKPRAASSKTSLPS
jgi:hypothetical protein